jgi:hypothetical protein
MSLKISSSDINGDLLQDPERTLNTNNIPARRFKILLSPI